MEREDRLDCEDMTGEYLYGDDAAELDDHDSPVAEVDMDGFPRGEDGNICWGYVTIPDGFIMPMDNNGQVLEGRLEVTDGVLMLKDEN